MLDLAAGLGVPGVRVAVSGRAEGSVGLSDDPAARSAFLARAGLAGLPLAGAKQVHGARVLVVGRDGLAPSPCIGEGDALATADRGIALLVLSADCAVGAIADPAGRALGVFHAGWRGALAGAPGACAAAVAARAGVPPASLRVVLGPAIGPCCYEVGEAVIGAPGAAPWLRPGKGDRPHFDLPAAVRGSLLGAGLSDAAVNDPGLCTLCGAGWFSHRRGDAGRQALVAALA